MWKLTCSCILIPELHYVVRLTSTDRITWRLNVLLLLSGLDSAPSEYTILTLPYIYKSHIQCGFDPVKFTVNVIWKSWNVTYWFTCMEQITQISDYPSKSTGIYSVACITDKEECVRVFTDAKYLHNNGPVLICSSRKRLKYGHACIRPEPTKQCNSKPNTFILATTCVSQTSGITYPLG